MHRFYFHLYAGDHRITDREGRILPSFQAALEEAAAIGDQYVTACDNGEGRRGCHVEIVDSYGILLRIVTTMEA